MFIICCVGPDHCRCQNGLVWMIVVDANQCIIASDLCPWLGGVSLFLFGSDLMNYYLIY